MTLGKARRPSLSAQHIQTILLICYNRIMWKDDEEGLGSLSSSDSRRYERADGGKKERKEQKANRKGKLLSLKRMLLRQTVDDEHADPDRDGQMDDEKKRKEKRDEEAEANKAFHTETQKEKEEKEIDSALKQMDPEDLIAKQKQQEEEAAEAGQEYQSQAG